MTCHVKEWQLCLSYFWHYLSLLCLKLIMHWFRVCYVKSNTFWNILMLLGSNEKQDQTTCHIQEWHFFYFWSYLPFLCLDLMSCVCSVTCTPFGIFWWYLVEMENWTRWLAYKNDNSGGIEGWKEIFFFFFFFFFFSKKTFSSLFFNHENISI